MPGPQRAEPEAVESRRAQRHHQRVAARRRRWILIGAGLLAVALIATVVVVVIADDDPTKEKEATPLLVLGDYSISGTLVVEAGDVKFAVANLGKVPHNVGIRGGPITADLFPDQAGKLELLGLQPGSYELFCDIVGHAARGMVATLQVVEPGQAPIPTA